MLSWLKDYRKKAFDRFLAKRLPEQKQLSLTHNNLFILPNQYGVVFLLIIVAMYILATNYQSNLVLMLAYLLGALFLVTLHLSFFNLSGLSIRARLPKPVFAGEQIQLPVLLESKRHKTGLSFSHYQDLKGKQWSVYEHVGWLKPGQQRVALKIPVKKRGVYSLGRFKLKSVAPFGWFNVWTLPNFGVDCMVYPKPEPCPMLMNGTGRYSEEGEAKQNFSDQDDFVGLKDFVETDPLKHVAWKQLAQGRGMLTKEFASAEQDQLWYSIYLLPAQHKEQALSQLCWLVLQAGERKFGIELYQQTLGPGQGSEFIVQCLSALARHE